MMKKVVRSAIILLILLIAFVVVIFFSRSFFEYSNPINSNILIIEAWIQPFEIEQAFSLINSGSVKNVFIIGQNYPDDSFSIIAEAQNHFIKDSSAPKKYATDIWLYTNSSLCFDLNKNLLDLHTNDSILFVVTAKGSSAAGLGAHFNLIVNGKFIGGAFTSETDSSYPFQTNIGNHELRSLIVRFDNDLVHNNQDRNLQVISVQVGETEITANEQTTFLIKKSGRFSTGFNSMAEEKRNYLVHLGVSANKLKGISFESVRQNQTLAAALAFRNNDSSAYFLSANILSSGLHSRRTLVTYQKVLGKNWIFGVTSNTSSDYKSGSKEKAIIEYLQLVEEFFSYIYNWLYLSLG